jgi:ribosomal 50S subunit-recycling heat shock protein
MRLDKFLKVSRILKRRSVAKELIDNDRVFVNEKKAKPSSFITVGDIIRIRFGLNEITVRVLEVRDFTKKNESTSLYEIIGEKRLENND